MVVVAITFYGKTLPFVAIRRLFRSHFFLFPIIEDKRFQRWGLIPLMVSPWDQLARVCAGGCAFCSPLIYASGRGIDCDRLNLRGRQFIVRDIVNNGREEEIESLARKLGHVAAEDVSRINSSLTQTEYKTILREPLPKERVEQMCEERVLYKGSWVLPNDPIARKFIDQQLRKR